MANSSIIKRAKNKIIKEFIKDKDIVQAINSSEITSPEKLKGTHIFDYHQNPNTINNPYLFISLRNTQKRNLTKAGVEKIIRDLCASSGITRRVYPHLIRHTTATLGLQRGMDVTEIQKMLGHSNIETTMIYAKVSSNSVKNSHKKYIV